MQPGNLATTIVSGIAMLLLMGTIAVGRGRPLLAPLAFYLLMAVGVCEVVATGPLTQALGAAGFTTALGAIVLAVLGVERRDETFRWDQFEAAFRSYVEAHDGDTQP